MKLFCTLLVLLVGVSLLDVVAGIDCRRPSIGRYLSSYRFECVDLLKENCVGLKTKNTRLWHRGVNVKDNCSKIRTMSAIATFAGPNNRYSGGPYKHAAIFSSCDSNGIWVYDQWNGSRGVRYRYIRYDGAVPNGASYFTVVV